MFPLNEIKIIIFFVKKIIFHQVKTYYSQHYSRKVKSDSCSDFPDKLGRDVTIPCSVVSEKCVCNWPVLCELCSVIDPSLLSLLDHVVTRPTPYLVWHQYIYCVTTTFYQNQTFFSVFAPVFIRTHHTASNLGDTQHLQLRLFIPFSTFYGWFLENKI